MPAGIFRQFLFVGHSASALFAVFQNSKALSNIFRNKIARSRCGSQMSDIPLFSPVNHHANFDRRFRLWGL